MSATQERALVPVNAANGGPPAMLPVRIETQSIDLMTLAKALAGSGYFKDTRDASQAVVKILYGQELGIGPVSAMMGIHIIEGKPSPSANLLGAMIKRSRRYDYRVICHTADRAEIAFFEHGEELGRIVWTIEDAARAELAGRGTWKKYPGQMLFSRCLSEGVRVYAPDLFGGAPVYTPEEMGAEVDGETGEPLRVAAATVNTQTGEVIDAPSRTASAEQHESYAGATGLKAPNVADVRKRVADLMGQIGVPEALLAKPKPYFERVTAVEIGKLSDLKLSDWQDLEQILSLTLETKRAAFGAYGEWCKREGHDVRDRDFRLSTWGEILGRAIETTGDLTQQDFARVGNALDVAARAAGQPVASDAAAEDDPFEE